MQYFTNNLELFLGDQIEEKSKGVLKQLWEPHRLSQNPGKQFNVIPF